MRNQLKKAVPYILGLQLAVAGASAQSTADVVKAIDAEQYAKAKSLSKSLIAAKPAEAANYYYLGKLYLDAGYIDSARTAFQQGVTAGDKEPLNYVGLGAVSLEQRNAADAQANFQKALALAPKKDNNTHIEIGRAYLGASKPDYNGAAKALNAAIAIDDKDAVAHMELGNALDGQKKHSEAYTSYTKAADLDKSLLRAKIGLGILVKRSTAYKESADEFNKVIAADPNYAPAYRELAETYYLWANADPKNYDARIKQALDYYKQYVTRTDQSLESRMRYADFLILAKDYKTLEAETRALAGNEQSNLRIYRYLGYSAFENQHYPESVAALSSWITKADTSRIIASDYFYLGQAQLKTGANADAVTNLKKAVAMDPANAAVMSDIAKALYSARQYADAGKAYEVAVSNPASKTIAYDNFYLGLANYFDYAAKVKAKDSLKLDSVALKQPLVTADTAFSRVIALSPTSPDAYLFRARVKRLTDNQENPVGFMVPDYEKYVSIATAKADWQTDAAVKKNVIESYSYLAAFSAKKQDNVKQAIEYLNKIRELDPTNAYALATLKSLQVKQPN